MKRVYQVDDCDWFIATSKDHALKLAMEMTGCSLEDYNNGDDCCALTIKQLWKFRYLPDTDNPSKYRSALLQVIWMMFLGQWKSGFFASSEF